MGIKVILVDVIYLSCVVTPSNRKLDLNVVSSAYHLEITPSDMGTNDRIVIQHLLKEVAQMEQVDFKDSRDGLAHRYKCVIINEADSLTRDAQAALRRTMEKYSRNIRLIMICDSVSSIISPIKSRCFMVRCPAPNEAEMIEILKHVSKEEKVTVDSDQVLQKIARESAGNLRKGLLMLEAMALSNEMHLKKETPVMRPDWESVITKLANKIQKEKSVGCLVECRSVLYDLLAHCIPARTILQELTFALLQSSKTDETKVAIIETSSIFDERLSLGNKPIYHLEGFVARAMCSM